MHCQNTFISILFQTKEKTCQVIRPSHQCAQNFSCHYNTCVTTGWTSPMTKQQRPIPFLISITHKRIFIVCLSSISYTRMMSNYSWTLRSSVSALWITTPAPSVDVTTFTDTELHTLLTHLDRCT